MPKESIFAVGGKQEKQNRANKKHKDSQLKDLTATLVVEGNPTLKADTIIEVAGTADIHEGKWYVAKVTHSIAKSGFVTTLELKKNASNKPATLQSQNVAPNIAQQTKTQNFPTNSTNKVQEKTQPSQAISYDAYGKTIKK